MYTKRLGRSETRSISIAAPRETVLALLGDARRLPDWAPAFARVVEPADDEWLINPGAGQFRIGVRVSVEHGTVDLLRPNDPPRGTHGVLHNEKAASSCYLDLPSGPTIGPSPNR